MTITCFFSNFQKEGTAEQMYLYEQTLENMQSLGGPDQPALFFEDFCSWFWTPLLRYCSIVVFGTGGSG